MKILLLEKIPLIRMIMKTLRLEKQKMPAKFENLSASKSIYYFYFCDVDVTQMYLISSLDKNQQILRRPKTF